MGGVVFRFVPSYIFTPALLFIRFLVAERFNYKADATNLSNGNVSKWRKKSALSDRPGSNSLKRGKTNSYLDEKKIIFFFFLKRYFILPAD
jgi:hypothetical protein